MKRCSMCRLVKPLDEFSSIGRVGDLPYACIQCAKGAPTPADQDKRTEARRVRNREYMRRKTPDEKRAYLLMRVHGLTPEQWDDIYWSQGGLCYLCLLPMTRKDARVDHDHAICPAPRYHSCEKCRRGLAHDACNTLIGMAQDSPEQLRQIADSLEAKIAAVSRA